MSFIVDFTFSVDFFADDPDLTAPIDSAVDLAAQAFDAIASDLLASLVAADEWFFPPWLGLIEPSLVDFDIAVNDTDLIAPLIDPAYSSGGGTVVVSSGTAVYGWFC